MKYTYLSERIPQLVVLWLLLPVALMCLPSCSDLGIRGEAAYIFEDGSKARLVRGSEGDTSAEYWRRVGDSWVKVRTSITPKVEPTE